LPISRLSPSEWHQCLERRGDGQYPLLIDVRNYYESRIGFFPGSSPINTETHRSACEAVDRLVSKVSPSDPVYLYCTGGIRCEKMAAYLTQLKGFTNVKSLQGGILAYTKAFPGNQSLFKGVNFTFDQRLVSRVTDDVLTQCDQCGKACDLYANCLYCDLLFIQCTPCKEKFSQCCSKECTGIHFNMPAERKRALTTHLRRLCKLPGNPGFLRPTMKKRNTVSYLDEVPNLPAFVLPKPPKRREENGKRSR